MSYFENPLPESNWQSILAAVPERDEHEGYHGNVTPEEAVALLATCPQAQLIDVRTTAETQWVGGVPHAIEIEWVRYPSMAPNPNFMAQLCQAVPSQESVLLFLCRSGARSIGAAKLAAAEGYRHCYNILEGFEGPLDANSHRGTISGWRRRGLPWRQM